MARCVRPFLLLSLLGFLPGASPAQTPPPQDRPPRLIVRFDAALLGLPSGGAKGGGGVLIPLDGTGAGFLDTAGVSVGAELRLSRWIGLDASVDWYRPSMEVDRDRGPDEWVDHRTASAALRTLTLGLVITPPRWRVPQGRFAVAALVSRGEVSDVPAHLGISVEEDSTGVGFDVRGELYLTKNRHWGVGGVLSFVSVEPPFVDLETGYRDSLQVGTLRLRLGVRGAW